MKRIYYFIISFALLLLVGCSAQGKAKIKVGASSTPHALILAQTEAYLKKQGYELEVVVFDDYVLPNLALENNELDANYFQHKPYLNEFNESNNTHLVPVFNVHFEPMGIYAGNKNSLDQYQEGDKIVVPSDKSNYDRAVNLLNANNIINPELVMVEAQNIPLTLSDCAFAVVNGNYALSSNIINKCIVTEDKSSEIANTMANVIAVKKGNENSKKINALIEALKQENVKQYIEVTFGSSVIPIMEK